MILVAEDDPGVAELARRALTRAGRLSRTVSRVQDAVELLSREPFLLVIADFRLEDGDAWPILGAAYAAVPRVPVIVVTALGDERVASEAVHRGAAEYVIKTDNFWERLPDLVNRVVRASETAGQNELVASVVRFSEDAIFATSLDGRIRSWNPAAERLFGHAEDAVVGRHVRVLFPDHRLHEIDSNLQLLRHGEACPVRRTVRTRRDGTAIHVAESVSPMKDASGKVTGAAIVVRDITQQRSLEAQLRHAQKMDAVGRLAGGVAHDFNNLLTVIGGYSDLLASSVDPRSTEGKQVAEIRKAGERAARLTHQLLAFSRKQVSMPAVLHLNVVITELATLLHRLIGEDVELATVLDATADLVRIDRGHLEQVILNLAVNARDAMSDGGRLTISTKEVELDGIFANQSAELKPGRYVLAAVSDTGAGMDRETAERVFEPFFTTKPVGKGTGLGLSTVHGIVKQSGGHIGVHSELGQGATFRVYLPQVLESGAVRDAAATSATRATGTETILVAEDDASIRRLVRGVLEAHGYTVLGARSGSDALATCEQFAGEIHLILTDVVMPGASGPEVARRLAAERPATRVLFMSGYTDEAIFREGRLERGMGYLAKPFTADQLLRRIREILDATE